MDAIIPETVLAHLRSVSERSVLAGGFTTEQLAEAMGISREKARKQLRKLVRGGRVESRHVGVTQEEANKLGYLAGGKLVVYYEVTAE